MNPRLVLVSTGIGVVDSIKTMIKNANPAVEVCNIVDDSIVNTIAANSNVIPPDVFKRLVTYITLAEEIGARAVLVTCSSISEVVDIAQTFVKIPVFKIDEPMANEAINTGNCIGVVATLATTLEPTKRLIRRRAEQTGKSITIKDVLCNGAFSALQNGDPATHDLIVREAVEKLTTRCDVVVLAQASMARAASSISNPRCPILTSPKSGITRVLAYLKSNQ